MDVRSREFQKGGGEAKNVEFSELDPYNKNLK